MNYDSNLTAKSVSQIYPTLPPNALFMLFGSTATICSLITMYVVIRSQQLRKTKFFRLLLASVVCDLVLGSTYVAVGARRYYRYYSGHGEVMTALECFGEFSVNTFALIFSLSMAVALVVDRLLATAYPIIYKQASYPRLTLPLTLMAILYACVQIGVHWWDAWNERKRIVTTCAVQTMTTAQTLDNILTAQMVTSCTVIALNIFLGLLIRVRLQKARKTREKRAAAGAAAAASGSGPAGSGGNEIDMKIFKTITVMTIAHAVAHLGTRLCQLIASNYADEATQTIIFRYTRSLVVLNAALHFFLLLATSGDFRKATLLYVPWLRCGKNSTGIVGIIGITLNTKPDMSRSRMTENITFQRPITDTAITSTVTVKPMVPVDLT